MDYTLTQNQLEARGLLLESLGNTLAAAQAVRHQPSLTAAHREAVQWAIMAMLKAKRELSPERMEASE